MSLTSYLGALALFFSASLFLHTAFTLCSDFILKIRVLLGYIAAVRAVKLTEFRAALRRTETKASHYRAVRCFLYVFLGLLAIIINYVFFDGEGRFVFLLSAVLLELLSGAVEVYPARIFRQFLAPVFEALAYVFLRVLIVVYSLLFKLCARIVAKAEAASERERALDKKMPE